MLVDKRKTPYNIRFGNRLADGIKSAVVRYQQWFQQKNKYRLFVFIFGCSFSIGLHSGETFIEYQPIAKPYRWLKFQTTFPYQ